MSVLPALACSPVLPPPLVLGLDLAALALDFFNHLFAAIDAATVALAWSTAAFSSADTAALVSFVSVSCKPECRLASTCCDRTGNSANAPHGARALSPAA